MNEQNASTKIAPEKAARLRRAATYASLSVAATLIVTKLVAWTMTDSMALLSSLFDSVFDLMASAITAFGVASALRPPDDDHRYGHGKAEPLAALAQSAFVTGSAILLAVEAVDRFFKPRPIQNEEVGYFVMIVAIVLTFALVRFQRYVIVRTGSTAVGADRLHYVGDLAVNAAVMVAFALNRAFEVTWFDPAFSILISASLVYSAVKIFRHALDALMDRELPDGQREEILALVKAQDGVRGVHDMRTRTDGERVFVELHVEMDGGITLQASHDLAEHIMRTVQAQVPAADVLVHQDPVGHEEPRRNLAL